MAIDTKFNLSNNKFEQFGNEILNLSGCTQIFGQLHIESGATFLMLSNHGEGKILTSDANGIGTWQTNTNSASITGATNLGNGYNVYAGVANNNLLFKTLTGGTGIQLGSNTNMVIIGMGTPSDIMNTSINISSGTTHTHKFKSDTFITGTGGILVDGAGRFYIDNSYVTEATLPNLYTITGVTTNRSIGVLASGQTLGMVYIRNIGSATSYVNLGTTPTGDEITPYRTITIPSGDDVSVTVNMRLSNTLNKTIYISSTDWTNVELIVQWANISYQNASTTITPSDLPMASDITLGAIKIGDGISIDGNGVVSVDPIALDDLSNVNVPTPSTGDLLTYNGSQWINTGLTITTSLSGLTDVTLSSPVLGNSLVYNGYRWINSGLTLTTNLSGLTDVTLSSPVNGNLLIYNGSQWVNSGLTLTTNLSGLTDVTLSAPNAGDNLVYNGSQWINSGVTTGGFLGMVTRTSAEPTNLKQNQWVKPKPEASGNFSYTFTNFCSSLGSPIIVNLSLEDVYLRYCQSGDYWTKEYYNRPLSSGKTWIGNSSNAVCEIPVIDEWVYSDIALSYIGQKFSYPTQTIMKTDLDTCITIPNYIFIQNINLKNVGNTAIFTIPAGKVAVVNSLKLITLQTANPTTFKVSVGNNSAGPYNNISACYAISNVLQYETYCLPMNTTPGKALTAASGSVLYFRVATGSTSASELCAHLLVEAFLF